MPTVHREVAVQLIAQVEPPVLGKPNRCGAGELCVRYAEGSVSVVAVQEEFLERVDDSDSRRSSMERLIAGGLSAVDAKRLFPDLQ
jgi:hypothetical protein